MLATVHPAAAPSFRFNAESPAWCSDYGFHCDGGCCESVRDLAYDLGAPDLYVPTETRVEWDEVAEAEHALPPRGQLHSTQDYLDPAILAHYVAGGESAGPRISGDVLVVISETGWWVENGTHRLAAAYARGDATFVGKVFRWSTRSR